MKNLFLVFSILCFFTLNAFSENETTPNGITSNEITQDETELNEIPQDKITQDKKSQNTSSKKVNWFTHQMEHTVSASVHINTNTGYHPYPDVEHLFIPSTSFSYFFNMKELRATTGIHFSAKTFDLTNRVVYGPTFLNCFNVGLGVTHHLLSFNKQFLEQDVLVGFFFDYRRRSFTLTTDINYFFKCTNVYGAGQGVPKLKHHTLAFASRWSWFVLNHLDFYFDMNSYLPYRYALFWSPTCMTGLQWKFDNGCVLGGEVAFQFVDLMSFTAYLNMFEVRFFTRWIFK